MMRLHMIGLIITTYFAVAAYAHVPGEVPQRDVIRVYIGGVKGEGAAIAASLNGASAANNGNSKKGKGPKKGEEGTASAAGNSEKKAKKVKKGRDGSVAEFEYDELVYAGRQGVVARKKKGKSNKSEEAGPASNDSSTSGSMSMKGMSNKTAKAGAASNESSNGSMSKKSMSTASLSEESAYQSDLGTSVKSAKSSKSAKGAGADVVNKSSTNGSMPMKSKSKSKSTASGSETRDDLLQGKISTVWFKEQDGKVQQAWIEVDGEKSASTETYETVTNWAAASASSVLDVNTIYAIVTGFATVATAVSFLS